MNAEHLQQLLTSRVPGCEFLVHTEDNHHFEAIAIGEVFATIASPVKRQQLVMNALKEEFANQEVHALALKTYTPEQWAKVKD